MIFKMRFAQIIFAGLLTCLLWAAPTHAQDSDATRDPWDLARRLLGFDADYALPDPTPLYEPGDTAEFWVSKAKTQARTKITAELAALTPSVYVWVEEGIDYDERAIRNIAQQIDQIALQLRLLSLYGQPTLIPGTSRRLQDPTSLIEIPDVDADPHLFVLYAADLGDDDVVFNLNDSLPDEISPFSNQHEMIYVNTSAVPNAAPSDGVFLGLLARGLYEMLVNFHTPDQPVWLREALSLFVTRQLEMTQTAQNALPAFLQAPNTSLIQPSRLGTALPLQGGQQLFLDYLAQRFGLTFVQNLFTRGGEGVSAVDTALLENDLIDPVTLETFTARSVFADFVIANVLSAVLERPFGDGRYQHTVAQIPAESLPAAATIEDPRENRYPGQVVNQFATQYFYILINQPAEITLAFEGRETTPLLALPAASDPANHFYWSGRGRNQDATLTRAFDLTGVESATLTFDTWYDLANEWNYAYVQVSPDGGQSWAIVSAEASTTSNRHGVAYGAGFTGISNPEGPRPFPIAGVVIDADGVTITEIVPGGPVSQTEIQIGDKIVGYEGEEWPGTPNIIALLGNYSPGDTLELLIERDGERFDVPVVLGAHPTRVVEPAPLWLPQSVDLSAYAGQEILVRFEYVSMPDHENPGIALDNIAIEEIDFVDDAERDSGWTLNGWQRVNNQVDQQFLLQAAAIGSRQRPPSVRQLIRPDEQTTSGAWTFNVTDGEVLVIAVSGLNDNTDQPAQFDLTMTGTE